MEYSMFDLAYCPECNDLVEFDIKEEDVEEIFRGKKIRYKFSMGRCKVCETEVVTNLAYNHKKSDAKWDAFNQLK